MSTCEQLAAWPPVLSGERGWSYAEKCAAVGAQGSPVKNSPVGSD